MVVPYEIDWRYSTVKKGPPFRIEEEGWGEFDLSIILTATEKGGDHTVGHDLNFAQPRYESVHTIVSSSYNFLVLQYTLWGSLTLTPRLHIALANGAATQFFRRSRTQSRL